MAVALLRGLLLLALGALASSSGEAPVETVSRPVQHVDTMPRLHLVEKFATDQEMDHIIREAFPLQKPQDQDTETGIVCELPVKDPILEGIYDRMRSVLPGLADPIGKGEAHGLETLRVRRYLSDGLGLKGGDYHPPHTDWFEPTRGDLSNVLIVTMILYLTSPEAGGTTFFRQALGGKVSRPGGRAGAPGRGTISSRSAATWLCGGAATPMAPRTSTLSTRLSLSRRVSSGMQRASSMPTSTSARKLPRTASWCPRAPMISRCAARLACIQARPTDNGLIARRDVQYLFPSRHHRLGTWDPLQ